MSDEERLQIITAQLVLVRDNLFRGMSKSMQKLQARSINEVLELPNFTQSPQRTWVGMTDEILLDAALAALPSEITEPRGCPTPGSCSAVAEIADLKQRLLPQANGRAERAEKARQMAVVERDEMLEKLRAATSMPCAPSATGATDLNEFVRAARTFSDEHYQNSLVAELRRVYRAQEETAIGNARYEYIRTLNPRKFSALYNEALMGVHQFDDLVDRYRDAGGKPK